MKQSVRDDNSNVCHATHLWDRKMEFNFNVISFGQIFRNKTKSLVVGHEDGMVRVYPIPKSGETVASEYLESSQSLESKGGPIQTLAIQDVTKLNNNDVTVADSRGMVTVFCNGQIITRKAVSEHCIQCLKIQKDTLGHNVFVIGDKQGHVAAFSPFTDYWRLRLADVGQYKSLAVTPHVTCVHVAELSDVHGQRRSYVLVADSCRTVHLIQAGSIVLTLHTPAVVTAMTSGLFVDPENIESATGTNGFKNLEDQVVMGTDTGAIFIMANFQVYHEEYANIQHTITSLQTLPAADSQYTDTLLCAGHFDALCILRQGKEITRHKTPAWITSLVTADVNNDGIDEVIFGCHDSTIHAIRLQFS